MKTKPTRPARETKKPGERLNVESRRGVRSGEIVEVNGGGGREHYLVRWDDGRLSTYYPRLEPELKRSKQPQKAPRRVSTQDHTPHATPGDRLVIHGHHLGEPERDAKILEARGDDGGPPFVVRWSDTGRVGIVYPGSDASVDHLAQPRDEKGEKR